MSDRFALVLLVSAQFVVMLDGSIVNVAVPSMQQDLGLSHVGVAWVVNAYFLAFGGFLLLSGRLADLVGRRRMFMIGSAVFTVGTITAGLAPSETVLVAARVLQGLGAAALSPAALSMLLMMFTGPARAKAMSMWGAASTLGGATGVVAGGLLAGSLGWSWVFFVTVPVTVGALALAPSLLGGSSRSVSRSVSPSMSRERADAAGRRFDVGGAAAITGAALALIYAALSVPEHGLLSLQAVGGLALAAIAVAMFVRAERRSSDPLVPLELFRSARVTIGVAVGVLGGAARASTFFIVAMFLQQALLLDPAAAGLAMVPTSIAGFLFSTTVLPRLIRRLGAERSVIVGLIVLAAAHLWLTRSRDGASYLLDVLPGLLVAAIGVAMSFTPTTMVIASGVPTERSGLASGLANASSQIGAAIGVATLSAAVALGSGGSAGAHDGPGGAQAGPTVALAAFHGAFTTAAVLAIAAAALGGVLLIRRSARAGRNPGDFAGAAPGRPGGSSTQRQEPPVTTRKDPR